MIGSIMLFAGAAMVIAWGIAHIAIPTKGIVRAFEPLSADNRRILLMEWLMEGVLLIFLGALVILIHLLAPGNEVTPILVYRAAAVALFVMAGVSLATGARTRIGPMRLCPPIFITAAVLFWLPTVI